MPDSPAGNEDMSEEPDGGVPAPSAAPGSRSSTARSDFPSGSYDSWTVPQLRRRAKELGMTGYSALNKSDLIFELRKR